MNTHQKVRRTGTALLLGALLALGACGSDGSSGSDTTTETAAAPETAAPDTAAPETAAPDTAAPETAAPDTAAPDTAAPTAAAGVALADAPCFDLGPVEGLATIAPGARLRIAATVAPITSIVANIAGDAADVTGLVPEGINSHTYEPTPSVAKAVASADLIIINGLKLEDPTRDLAEANKADGAAIVELGNRTIGPDGYIYDFSFPEEGGKPNPHLWTNPPMAGCYARIAAMAMSQADPANAATYGRNLGAYLERLADLDARFRTATATVPAANRKLLTYHDAYAYFAKEYGWEVLGAVQVSDFEDPTPKEVAELIDQVRRTGVPAIFGSEVFPSPVLEQIGKETGVRYVDVLRDDDLPGAPGDPEHSFLALMRFDYRTIVEALGGDPAAIDAFDPSDVAPDRAVYPQ
jgi:ABC-type Zn uptake system ZnuABC Zn-binding protein ZnuA